MMKRYQDRLSLPNANLRWARPFHQGRPALLAGLLLFTLWALPASGQSGVPASVPAPTPPARLRFEATETAEFRFDTGVLRGKLRAGGKCLGLSSVVHLPSGVALDRGTYGLFSHYRVFSANRRYGTAAWDWPNRAKLIEDGAVEVVWPAAAPNRPFEMTAVYRWAGPAMLDLETSVRPLEGLANFEVFLASYFHPQFTNALVWVKTVANDDAKPVFQAAEKAQGDWQMFPRHDAVLPLIQDGRWLLEPNPVKWVIRPFLAQPLGVRRAPGSGLTALLMAPSQDCFALAMPHQAEGHYSIYLSLFGRNIPAGETARARARMLVASNPSAPQIIEHYRAYQAPNPGAK